MICESAVDARAEELWDVLAQEFDDGGPAQVIHRVATAELREREKIVAYLRGMLPKSTVVDRILGHVEDGVHLR